MLHAQDSAATCDEGGHQLGSECFSGLSSRDQQQTSSSSAAQSLKNGYTPDLRQAMTFVILEHDKFLQSRAAFHVYRTNLAYSNLAIRRI
jgi:hypothetical protein